VLGVWGERGTKTCTNPKRGIKRWDPFFGAAPGSKTKKGPKNENKSPEIKKRNLHEKRESGAVVEGPEDTEKKSP